MTAKEALALLKMQLKATEQNKEAFKVLDDLVNDEPEYTLDHLFGGVSADLDNLCVRYDEEEYDFSNAREYKLGKKYGK